MLRKIITKKICDFTENDLMGRWFALEHNGEDYFWTITPLARYIESITMKAARESLSSLGKALEEYFFIGHEDHDSVESAKSYAIHTMEILKRDGRIMIDVDMSQDDVKRVAALIRRMKSVVLTHETALGIREKSIAICRYCKNLDLNENEKNIISKMFLSGPNKSSYRVKSYIAYYASIIIDATQREIVAIGVGDQDAMERARSESNWACDKIRALEEAT